MHFLRESFTKELNKRSMIDYHFHTIDDRKVTRNAIQRTRALFILKKLSVNYIKNNEYQ